MNWPEFWVETDRALGERLDRALSAGAHWRLLVDSQVVGEAREVDLDGAWRWLKHTRFRPLMRLRLEVRDARATVRWWVERPAGLSVPPWRVGCGSLEVGRMRVGAGKLMVESGSDRNPQTVAICRFRRRVWGGSTEGELARGDGTTVAKIRWWRPRWYSAIGRWEVVSAEKGSLGAQEMAVAVTCALVLGCIWCER